MSEELNREAPTSVQNSTQKGTISLPDFNFSIQGNISLKIHLTADPTLQAALEKIAEALKPVEKKTQPCSTWRPKPDEIEPLSEEDEAKLEEVWKIIKEANLESEKIEIEKHARKEVEKYEKSVTKTKRKSKPEKTIWKKIPGTKHAKYAEDGQALTLKYLSGSVPTTWKKMLELSEFVGDAYREARDKNLGSFKNPNQLTAINQFVLAIQNKTVTPPTDTDKELDENFAAFQEEEEGDGDPDAAFRPMLTAYSTRPDANSGKVEGDMGVGL